MLTKSSIVGACSGNWLSLDVNAVHAWFSKLPENWFHFNQHASLVSLTIDDSKNMNNFLPLCHFPYLLYDESQLSRCRLSRLTHFKGCLLLWNLLKLCQVAKGAIVHIWRARYPKAAYDAPKLNLILYFIQWLEAINWKGQFGGRPCDSLSQLGHPGFVHSPCM